MLRIVSCLKERVMWKSCGAWDTKLWYASYIHSPSFSCRGVLSDPMIRCLANLTNSRQFLASPILLPVSATVQFSIYHAVQVSEAKHGAATSPFLGSASRFEAGGQCFPLWAQPMEVHMDIAFTSLHRYCTFGNFFSPCIWITRPHWACLFVRTRHFKCLSFGSNWANDGPVLERYTSCIRLKTDSSPDSTRHIQACSCSLMKAELRRYRDLQCRRWLLNSWARINTASRILSPCRGCGWRISMWRTWISHDFSVKWKASHFWNP